MFTGCDGSKCVTCFLTSSIAIALDKQANNIRVDTPFFKPGIIVWLYGLYRERERGNERASLLLRVIRLNIRNIFYELPNSFI